MSVDICYIFCLRNEIYEIWKIECALCTSYSISASFLGFWYFLATCVSCIPSQLQEATNSGERDGKKVKYL